MDALNVANTKSAKDAMQALLDSADSYATKIFLFLRRHIACVEHV